MIDPLKPGDRVAYRPCGFFATYLGADENGMARIRWDDTTETVVNPLTLDLCPHVVLIPRAEVRKIHQDHGSPSFPQVDGAGVVELLCVELMARDYREAAQERRRQLAADGGHRRRPRRTGSTSRAGYCPMNDLRRS